MVNPQIPENVYAHCSFIRFTPLTLFFFLLALFIIALFTTQTPITIVFNTLLLWIKNNLQVHLSDSNKGRKDHYQ
jgi:hypothetical protein